MFKSLKLIRLLREVDGLAFRERARIKVKLCGHPSYCKITKITSGNGQKVVEEYYLVPIFYQSSLFYDPLRIAIHEVRHRVQLNHPEMHLFTVEDMPDKWRARVRPEIVKKATLREIDAQVFDMLAYPIISANRLFNTDDFLKLLFHGIKS